MGDRLFVHIPHKHIPRNINHVHKAERVGLNQRIAIIITNALGSVPCMYLFVILAIIGFPGFAATPQQYVQWVSQTFIQLVALSVLGIAQNVLSRHQELQADEMFATTEKSFHDIEQIMQHLEAQDAELLRQSTMLLELMEQTKRPQPTSKLKTVRVVRSEGDV